MHRAWSALALLLAACSASETTGTAGAVSHDSAGVRIIESGPIPADLPVWRPTGVLLDIGRVEGEAPYMLDRVADAVRLDGGGIAIVDGGSVEVRLFDAAGAFVGRFGGEGEGPGRFGAPSRVWQHGDSLVVWDSRLRRTTVFPLDGGDPRVIVPIDVQINVGAEAYKVGSALVVSSNENRQTSESTRDVTTHYVAVPLDGGLPDTLASMDAGSSTAVPLELPGGGRIVAVSPPIFSGSLLEASVGSHFVFGNSAAPEVRIMEAGDRAVRVIRWTSTAVPVTAEHVETYARRLVDLGATEELVRGRIGGAGTAATFPHHAGLAAEPGHFWIRGYRPPGVDGPQVWTRFSFAGEAVARIELPEDVTLLQPGPDFVLVRRSDDLGVQHVVLLGIGPG